MSKKILFVRLTPKPEFRDPALMAILALIPPTREEPGCLAFDLHEGEDGSLYLYEVFADEQAFQFHLGTAYTRKVLDNFSQWLAHPPEATRLRELAPR